MVMEMDSDDELGENLDDVQNSPQNYYVTPPYDVTDCDYRPSCSSPDSQVSSSISGRILLSCAFITVIFDSILF